MSAGDAIGLVCRVPVRRQAAAWALREPRAQQGLQERQVQRV